MMIDDLSTRAALTVAALLLLATGLSVISLSGGSETLESARELARHIARQLDAIGRLDAEVEVRFGPEERADVPLPSELGGHPYRMEIWMTDVRIFARNALAAEPLHVRVHPFPPHGDMYSDEELRDPGPLVLSSGASFQVLRTALLVDGQRRFLTFAFAD